MQEITFEDVLTHYQLKLKELSDEIAELENEIKKSYICIENGWKSDAGESCTLKLQTVETELSKVKSEISESQIKLTAIVGNLEKAALTAVII